MTTVNGRENCEVLLEGYKIAAVRVVSLPTGLEPLFAIAWSPYALCLDRGPAYAGAYRG